MTYQFVKNLCSRKREKETSKRIKQTKNEKKNRKKGGGFVEEVLHEE